MIVRFNIEPAGNGEYDYRVTHEGEALYGDEGLGSVKACIVAATEGLGSEPIAAEIAYEGIVSGTYPLATLALASAQLAEHAINTAAAIAEVTR